MPSHYGNGNGNGNGNGRATTTTTTTNDNPVTRLFNAPTSPRYYRPDGTIVPVGARLHQHQDGTIMTEHAMGPNDNSVVVTINQGVTAPRTAQRGNASIVYVFADTGERYDGRVVNIGGINYSTDTGTKQGNSRELTTQTVPIRSRALPNQTTTVRRTRQTNGRNGRVNTTQRATSTARRTTPRNTNMMNGTNGTRTTRRNAQMRTTRRTTRRSSY